MNNPIMYGDPSGHFVITLSAVLWAAAIGAAIGAVSGAVYGGITVVANGQNVWAGIAFGTGFVGGMVADASTQVINDGGVTGAIGMTIDILRNRKNQKQKVSVNNQLYAYCF